MCWRHRGVAPYASFLSRGLAPLEEEDPVESRTTMATREGRSAFKGWLLLWVLALALLWISWSSPVRCCLAQKKGNDPSKCQKAKEINLLQCHNGGELYSALNTSRMSCSRCECSEDGKWTGIDCSCKCCCFFHPRISLVYIEEAHTLTHLP